MSPARPGRLPRALEHISQAAAAWQEIVRLTDGVYSDRLMLTRSSSPQHWKNSLAEVNQRRGARQKPAPETW